MEREGRKTYTVRGSLGVSQIFNNDGTEESIAKNKALNSCVLVELRPREEVARKPQTKKEAVTT
jgi:hypothetical protein